MGRKPKISLVIPTYNAARTLDRALASACQQSWPDREIIVIDGGSGDGTRAIVEANRLHIAVFVSEPDGGIYDAINKGIALATGDLIGVLGADDTLCDEALPRLAAAWRETQPDIICGQALMVAPDGSQALRPDEDYGPGALLSGIPFCHNAMFATRGAYGAVGNYDLHYRLCADAHWVHRAIRAGLTCRQVDAPVVRFGLQGASSTNGELIMTETYALILANFPGLSLTDAQCLFQAIRGWSDGAGVEAVLRRHCADGELLLAASLAFASRARRLNNRQTMLAVVPPAPVWRRVLGGWRRLARPI